MVTQYTTYGCPVCNNQHAVGAHCDKFEERIYELVKQAVTGTFAPTIREIAREEIRVASVMQASVDSVVRCARDEALVAAIEALQALRKQPC